MARTLVAVTTLVTMTVLGVRPAAAQSDDTAQLAADTGLDEQQLRGAVNTVGVSAREYLQSEGVLSPPGEHASQAVGAAVPSRAPAVTSPFANRIDCLVRYESGGNPNAVNRLSGAAGLLQFLPSTWRSTPQGRAGLSVFDPGAARAAAVWMLAQGRAREWVPIQKGLC